jgi:plasmid stability protein
MPNITLSIDDGLLEEGRKYAHAHHTSLNALIRDLLSEAVTSKSGDWLTEAFQLMDQAKANSRGKKWKREDLYDA